jgi:uncharacterized cupredoxin-like copper-binding protein
VIPRLDAACRRCAIGAVLALALALGPAPAAADDAAGHGHDQGGHGASFGMLGKAAQVGRTVRIEASDIKFNIVSLDVRTGETIRFVVVNKGESEHDFTLGDAASQKAHRAEMAKMMEHGKMDHGPGGMHHDDPNAVFVKPGETKELIWTFTRPGTFEFACNVPGHYEAGMHGKITVSAGPEK